MKNFEVCLHIKESLQKTQAETSRLEAAISATREAQAGLDAAAIRARALETRDSDKREEEARVNRESLPQLESELEAAKQKVLILETEFKKVTSLAIQDVKEKYREPFQAAVKEFLKAVERAAELERKIQDIREQADAEGSQISTMPICWCPPLSLLLIERSGDPTYSPLMRFKADLKDAGVSYE